MTLLVWPSAYSSVICQTFPIIDISPNGLSPAGEYLSTGSGPWKMLPVVMVGRSVALSFSPHGKSCASPSEPFRLPCPANCHSISVGSRLPRLVQ